jgi:hypothetical protein
MWLRSVGPCRPIKHVVPRRRRPWARFSVCPVCAQPRSGAILGRSIRRRSSRLRVPSPQPVPPRSPPRCRTARLRHGRRRATDRRSPSSHGGTANTTQRATARRWRACCRGSWAGRAEIVAACSCRGGYSPQQCHGKFRPVHATAGHGAGPKLKDDRRLALERARRRSPPTGASCRPRRAARPPFSRSPRIAMIGA